MTRGHAEALRQADVPDLPALAALGPGTRVAGIQPETLERLCHQARLQARQRETGERVYDLLQAEPGRGLARLPKPDSGDMFFDMEGDPLFEGGLEYLFGVVTAEEEDERVQDRKSTRLNSSH